MRKKQLQLKLYPHQIKTLAKKNGEEAALSLYEAVYEELAQTMNPVLYYDYNVPAYPFFAGILLTGDGPDRLAAQYAKEKRQQEESILRILTEELLLQTDHALRELIRVEKRSRIERLAAAQGKERDEVLAVCRERWPDLPPFRPDAAGTIVYAGRLGAQFGCSNGGACQSCTRPTCGYRTD